MKEWTMDKDRGHKIVTNNSQNSGISSAEPGKGENGRDHEPPDSVQDRARGSYFARAKQRIDQARPSRSSQQGDFSPYPRPAGQGGGFGPGGYGLYGAQSEPRPARRDDQSAIDRMEGEGGGSRPDSEDTSGRFTASRSENVSGGWQDWPRQGPRNAEYGPQVRQSVWQREPLTAAEIMTSGVKVAHRETGVQEIARIMKEENVGVVPVVDAKRRLIGVVTDRDLVVRGIAEGRSYGELTAELVMTDDVEAVTPFETIPEVLELMGKKQVRRVPVVDRDDRLLGIISTADIANRADFDEDLQHALGKISTRRSFWSRLWA